MSVARLIHDAAWLVSECHAVVYAHWEIRILFLKDTAELNDICTSSQM